MAGCKQIFFSRDTGVIGTANVYKAPFAAHYDTNLTWGTPTAANVTQKVMIDGDIRNLDVELSAAPGGVTTRTFTLYKNGVATALTFTITGAATSGSSAAVVTVVAGDLVYLECATSGGPTTCRTQVTFEFNGANANETMYGGAGPVPSSTTQIYCPLLSNAVGIDNGPAGNRTSLVSAPGTITDLDIALTVAPGGVTTRTFAILKNTVLQDGSGGTPNTSVTITGSSLTGASSFSLAVAAGDEVRLTQTATGPPAASVCTFSVKVDSTTDEHSNLCGFNTTFLPEPGTGYSVPNVAGTWNNPEADELLNGPLSTVTLRDFRVLSEFAVTNQTYNTRKNTAASGITVNLTAATSGADSTNTTTLGSGDVWSLQATGDGGFHRTLAWAWTLEAPSDYVHQVRGSAVFGQDGTVTAPRSALFSLDGNTNTHAREGELKIAGSLSLKELSAAPTGVANHAVLYAIDNGSGKTKLMCIFGTGVAQQVAIEP